MQSVSISTKCEVLKDNETRDFYSMIVATDSNCTQMGLSTGVNDAASTSTVSTTTMNRSFNLTLHFVRSSFKMSCFDLEIATRMRGI